ncbi:MAG TPA: radical SAM protein [Elusimicrobiales bacterium]|nr:radical SAM protein [Elusimicrobiales bacterium]
MRSIKKTIFLLKLFIKLTPFRLYFKVLSNYVKNLLGFLTPASCVLGVTYRCQLNCPHCSAGKYEKEISAELDTKEIKKILMEIHKMGVPRLNITGGEAFLRKDIFEIVRFSSRYFITILETNGVAENEEVIKKLKESDLSCLSVSMDCLETKHEEIRNKKGLFENILRTLKFARKYKLPVILSTYVTRDKINTDFFKKFEEIAKSYNVTAIRVMPLRPVGNGLLNFCEKNLLTDEDEKMIIDSINPSLFYFKGIPGPSVCGIFLKNTFYISPYGEVQPCAYLPLSFGNIKNEDLKKILDRMWGHELFKKTKNKNCLIIDKEFREKIFKNASELPLEIR